MAGQRYLRARNHRAALVGDLPAKRRSLRENSLRKQESQNQGMESHDTLSIMLRLNMNTR